MSSQFDIAKEFPQRGSLRLCRLSKLTKFTCTRCGLEKSSKLMAFKIDKGDEPLCNGCYGFLLSNPRGKSEAP
ncbi:hypothetical protein BDZ45DRAFT_651117 [Acephala macrosclerotiorum]|nr:hypothetical protein BDZ45DRAFT_651117 [Acephala macrosclerotiorum]